MNHKETILTAKETNGIETIQPQPEQAEFEVDSVIYNATNITYCIINNTNNNSIYYYYSPLYSYYSIIMWEH